MWYYSDILHILHIGKKNKHRIYEMNGQQLDQVKEEKDLGVLIDSWNIVIAHFPNIPSITILKGHIISLVRPEKKTIFNIHDPVGLRYLFHLRVGLSPLRSHKNLHNFIDTPSGNCICNHGIEDTNHFLLLCPLFITQRASLMANVTAILLKYNLDNLLNQSHLLLYGHRTIFFSDNRQIILSTIKFIKETQRFS